MKLDTIVMLVIAGLIALLGLFAASRAVDVGMYVFGIVATLSGLSFGFWLLKMHFDAEV